MRRMVGQGGVEYAGTGGTRRERRDETKTGSEKGVEAERMKGRMTTE